MKTIRKSQYLWLKLKEKFANERSKTIEIEDVEYDNLMTNNHEIISTNNIKGLYLYKNDNIIDTTDNSNIYDICNITAEYEKYDCSFILEYTDGTFIGLPTSLIKFRLKNNIGELIYKNNNKYNKVLSYKSPEFIEEECEEQIIASYKGYECICKQINIKQNNYLFCNLSMYSLNDSVGYMFNPIFPIIVKDENDESLVTLPQIYLHNHNGIDTEITVNTENFYLLNNVNNEKIKLIFEEKEHNLYKILNDTHNSNGYEIDYHDYNYVTYEDKNITINLLDYLVRPHYNNE